MREQTQKRRLVVTTSAPVLQSRGVEIFAVIVPFMLFLLCNVVVPSFETSAIGSSPSGVPGQQALSASHPGLPAGTGFILGVLAAWGSWYLLTTILGRRPPRFIEHLLRYPRIPKKFSHQFGSKQPLLAGND